jgi:hypothetical protein
MCGAAAAPDEGGEVEQTNRAHLSKIQIKVCACLAETSCETTSIHAPCH